MVTKFYAPQNTPYKKLYLSKANWNAFLMAIANNIACIDIKHKNLNSLTYREF